MKKVVAILLMAAVVFAVAGCGLVGEKKDEKTIPVGVYVMEDGNDLEIVDGENIKLCYKAAGDNGEDAFIDAMYSYKLSHEKEEVFEMIVVGDVAKGTTLMLFYDTDTKIIDLGGEKFSFSEELTKAAAESSAEASSTEASSAE